MEQICIRVQSVYGKQDINIMESTQNQRNSYYNCLSKGQVVSILEKFVQNKMIEENKK